MRRQRGRSVLVDSVKVADEVWVATALLLRENPGRGEFTVAQIVERARQEAITGELRPGVYVHALQHCVANLPPAPGRYRALFATGKRRRRLFRQGDPYHPKREGAKIVPEREELPSAYRHLLDWYFTEYAGDSRQIPEEDPLLALRGSGKGLWAGEDPDTYVRRLREGWE